MPVWFTARMEKLLGANWRSSASGIGTAVMTLLATLAAAPYQLGEIAVIIPAAWKPTVLGISAASALTLKIINALVTKDKAVSGTPATGQTVGAAGEPVRTIPPQ